MYIPVQMVATAMSFCRGHVPGHSDEKPTALKTCRGYAVVTAIQETIRLMAAIETAIPTWPLK